MKMELFKSVEEMRGFFHQNPKYFFEGYMDTGDGGVMCWYTVRE